MVSDIESVGESCLDPQSPFCIGVAKDTNLKHRPTMEDTYAYVPNFLQPSESGVVTADNGYFGMFDGHFSKGAAVWCSKNMHIVLEDIIREHPNMPIPELFDMAFIEANRRLTESFEDSGSTAAVGVLRLEDRIPNGESSRQRVLYTANVGDTRIVLCREGKALRLSYDHKGTDQAECNRILKAGGVMRDGRVQIHLRDLAVTRAMGDALYGDPVTAHPYTTETVIQPNIDEFFILATDGLRDFCADQEAVDLVRFIKDPKEASKRLVTHALARGSTDNISCMVVRLAESPISSTRMLSAILPTVSTQLATVNVESVSDMRNNFRVKSIYADGLGSLEPQRRFVPQRVIEQLLTEENIERCLQNQDEDLISFVHHQARKVFATLVMCPLEEEELISTLKGLKEERFTDNRLPIEYAKTVKDTFYDVQWEFLVPVFNRDKHDLGHHILPFTTVFSYVSDNGIKQAHLPLDHCPDVADPENVFTKDEILLRRVCIQNYPGPNAKDAWEYQMENMDPTILIGGFSLDGYPTQDDDSTPEREFYLVLTGEGYPSGENKSHSGVLTKDFAAEATNRV